MSELVEHVPDRGVQSSLDLESNQASKPCHGVFQDVVL